MFEQNLEGGSCIYLIKDNVSWREVIGLTSVDGNGSGVARTEWAKGRGDEEKGMISNGQNICGLFTPIRILAFTVSIGS